LGDTGSGAVFVLLRGTAADAASAFDNAVAHARNGALTHDHMTARRDGDTARGRLVGALGQFAARPAERRRGDGLAPAAIGTRPDCVAHALQPDQAAAAVTDLGTHPEHSRQNL